MKEGAAEHLDGLDPHFSKPSHWNVTLEPLRSDGIDALNLGGIVAARVRDARLRELEIHSNNALHEVTICRSDNLFHRARCGYARLFSIPPTGILVRACIDLHLRGEDKPRKLQICPPHSVRLEPDCDPGLLWALLEKFRLHQTIAKVLAMIAIAGVTSFYQSLESLDDADDHRHGSYVVARR